ncbi:MAG: thioredoxin domain-containing protein [Leptospiraceae bacterium]|nr:thioredoxin domain-containing protein [Leptospiraceae bacterium]
MKEMFVKRYVTLTLIAAAASLLPFCGPPGPEATLDGKTYTIDDLDERTRIELIRQHNERVANALHNHVYEKMIEMEAEKKGMEKEKFLADLFSSYPNRRALNQKLSEMAEQYGLEVNPNLPALPAVDIAVDDDPVRGNPKAEVTVVEFSDFDCPYCIRIQPTARMIREKYGDRIKWVFKDFPLNQIHPDAMGRHVAANCVRKIDPDQYWDYFDAMFDETKLDQTRKDGGSLQLALSMGIDRQKFQECMDDPAMKQEIMKDIQQGEEVGVRGTPSFYLDGEALTNLTPEQFEAAVAEKLN